MAAQKACAQSPPHALSSPDKVGGEPGRPRRPAPVVRQQHVHVATVRCFVEESSARCLLLPATSCLSTEGRQQTWSRLLSLREGGDERGGMPVLCPVQPQMSCRQAQAWPRPVARQ